jgi:hypothetical protein
MTPRATVELSLVIRSGDREKSTRILLPSEVLTLLVIEASFRGISLTEFVANIIKEKV